MTQPERINGFRPDVVALLPDARRLAETIGETPSVRRLAAELKIGAPKAREIRHALDAGVSGPDALRPGAAEGASEGAPEDLVRMTGVSVPWPDETRQLAPAGRGIERGASGASGPVAPVRVPGRVLSWTALTVALGASVAANVASASHPGVGPKLTAAVAPVLVVLAAGLLERVSLVTARRWQRGLAGCGLMFVTGAAFVTSYQHQRALLIRYENPILSATLLPLAVDALIVMASVCLAVIGEQRRQMQAGRTASV